MDIDVELFENYHDTVDDNEDANDYINLILIAMIVMMEKKVCWIMGLTVVIVTKTNGV